MRLATLVASLVVAVALLSGAFSHHSSQAFGFMPDGTAGGGSVHPKRPPPDSAA